MLARESTWQWRKHGAPKDMFFRRAQIVSPNFRTLFWATRACTEHPLSPFRHLQESPLDLHEHLIQALASHPSRGQGKCFGQCAPAFGDPCWFVQFSLVDRPPRLERPPISRACRMSFLHGTLDNHVQGTCIPGPNLVLRSRPQALMAAARLATR